MSDTGIRRVFLSVFILFTACNGKMIEKGIESTFDPRVPEINIKQGSADINIDDSVVIASSGTQFIIENTGTEDLELTGAAAVSIAGDNPGDFEISEMTSGTLIPAGRNESFIITFVPQVEGTREATVTIESNDFDENPYVFTITGTSNPEIYVKQGATDVESGTGNFPISNIKVGESSDLILFTIENRGSFDLELTGAPPLVTSGDTLGELAVTQPADLTIIPGSETTFQVTFTPANTDAKIITVTIPNNDPDYGDFSFTITVRSKPVPDFSARLRKGLAPLIVSFEDATSGEVTSYEWDFNGDGITDSTDQNPVFIFSDPGSYSIVLSVKGPGGENYCVKTGYINVYTPTRHVIDRNFIGQIFPADIDNNGIIDVYGFGGNEIAWWENDGKGNFTKTSIATYNNVCSVYAAFIDNDNDLDIAAASQDGEIAWYQNGNNASGGGDGSVWSTKKSIDAVLYYPNSVYAADMDKDNVIDIITTESEWPQTLWYKSSGGANPAFTKYSITDTAAPGYIYPFDIDGDTWMDVIGSGGVWWRNDGSPATGMWAGYSLTDGLSNNIYAADLDGDNHLDLVGTGYGESQVAWWKNNGDLTFGSKEIIESSFYSAGAVHAEDFDGDSHVDVVASSNNLSTIAWWQNDGNSSPQFTKNIVDDSFINTSSLSGADINSDGEKDILAGSYSDYISWWDVLNGEYWYKHTINPYFGGAYKICTADFNNDGLADVVYRVSNAIVYHINQGNGILGAGQLLDTPTAGVLLYTVDMDNDGYIDILGNFYVASPLSDTLYWWKNNNGNGFSSKILIKTFPSHYLRSILPAKLDNDNDIDIAYSLNMASFLDKICWMENTDGAGTFGNENIIYSEGEAVPVRYTTSMCSADLDKNGFNDIVFTDSTGTTIAYFLNNGNKTFSAINIISNAYTGAYYAVTADINNDTNIDVVTTNYNNQIDWWENTGSGFSSTNTTVSNSMTYVERLYVDDLNYDGKSDIVAAGFWSNEIVWFKNINGNDQWIKNSIDANFSQGRSVCTADMDNDGDKDVVGTGSNQSILWWENNIKDYGLE